ncbi:hypothetical protein QBC38DRAFT_374031 [Podospora fimiseda]|uniref:Uncharacterized protein n=1 Tax=Podospora fimiseda TaxID=252190 RepID=A0AAN6YS58_9PEZI|nr:hypothetical protein QBC38DRAFT_374031 [Podospora fimiseda]
MDPEFFERRNKYLQTKPKTSGYKKTDFQMKLSRNPYAMALATPARRCIISACILPSFFFQQFKLLKHPETGEAWFVPQGLDKPIRMQVTADEGDGTIKEDGVTKKYPLKHPKGTTPGPSAFTLNSRRFIKSFQDKSSPYSGQYRKLMRMNDGGSGRFRIVLNNARWRPDMDEAILDTMRKRIVERLLEFATSVEQQDRKYIQPCTLDTFHEAHHRGSLVYLGTPDGSTESFGEINIPRLSTVDVKGKKYGWKITLHDLRVLLGDDYINQLRQESSLLRNGSLFLLARTATQPLQLLLWKLQMYLSLDLPEVGSGSQA